MFNKCSLREIENIFPPLFSFGVHRNTLIETRSQKHVHRNTFIETRQETSGEREIAVGLQAALNQKVLQNLHDCSYNPADRNTKNMFSACLIYRITCINSNIRLRLTGSNEIWDHSHTNSCFHTFSCIDSHSRFMSFNLPKEVPCDCSNSDALDKHVACQLNRQSRYLKKNLYDNQLLNHRTMCGLTIIAFIVLLNQLSHAYMQFKKTVTTRP